MQKTLSYLAIALLFVLGAIGGWWLRGLKGVPDNPPIIKTDTIWRHDTLRFPVPVPETRWVHDTTYIALTDSVIVHRHDTTYVQIPRETTYYRDSLYEAWVTGFRASLDSIHVFRSTAIVEVPVEKIIRKRWGLGLQAGATYIHNEGVTPYLGLGISYNILNF